MNRRNRLGFFRVRVAAPCRVDRGAERPRLIEGVLRTADDTLGGVRADDSGRDRVRHGGPDVHHGLGHLAIRAVRRAMQQRDLIVVRVHTVAVGFEDPADADHPEWDEFSGAQRSHAGRAEDGDAVVERQEDLLVPDRRRAAEHAVDDGDGARQEPARPEHVAATRRAEVAGRERPVAPRRPTATVPGTRRYRARSRQSVSGSRAPGTTTATTGMPNSGFVWSTAITCGKPAARRRSSVVARSSANVAPRRGDLRVRKSSAGAGRRGARRVLNRRLVHVGKQVVARARDEGEPRLRGLGERARQRDLL